jgi:voltage-gated potassium channel
VRDLLRESGYVRAVGSVEALERFERQTAWPSLILALASLPLIIIPLAWDLAPSTESTYFAIDWFIWAYFALEYLIRLYLSPSKGTFFRSNVLDLIIVILPFLRPLRIARSARLLRILGLTRAAVFVGRAGEAFEHLISRHRVNFTLLLAIIATVAAAVIVLEFERGHGGNIRDLPDSIWWAITTVTTVGYGNEVPITAGGRAVASLLMVLGIGLFGVLAATISAFFVKEDVSSDVDPQLAAIEDRLERIEQLLASKEPR